VLRGKECTFQLTAYIRVFEGFWHFTTGRKGDFRARTGPKRLKECLQLTRAFCMIPLKTSSPFNWPVRGFELKAEGVCENL